MRDGYPWGRTVYYSCGLGGVSFSSPKPGSNLGELRDRKSKIPRCPRKGAETRQSSRGEPSTSSATA
jgi:hypothetical protein